MGAFAGPADWWTDGTDDGRTHIATKGIVQSGLVLNLAPTIRADKVGNGNAVHQERDQRGAHAEPNVQPEPRALRFQLRGRSLRGRAGVFDFVERSRGPERISFL